MLLIDGRYNFIRSVFGSLGIYFLSLFKMPVKVGQILEATRSSFFAGAELNEGKIVWVKWPSVLAYKDCSGLMIFSLSAFNEALLLTIQMLDGHS